MVCNFQCKHSFESCDCVGCSGCDRCENCKYNNPNKLRNIGELSDGYHTFNELYYHRMILFAVICNIFAGASWRSWKHHDGTMYDDYFIVGVDTPEGQYSYHYHKQYWDKFKYVKELENAPEWDGHEPKDIERLLSFQDWV